ncbi:acylphosphatase [Pararhodospirillum oryzae]|uniref:acylphosphatase n=1 Tax=Pararhodospirillum oryzae TaxID=478448 RepID=A0A512H537_9PROT|nr:acylphosphatase [Pararhodospirillum oryzae]GEO80544.1 acylphosphatase [Pararhodospirillum oryzae]
MKTVRASILGRVQGVWYRGWTVETATKLGLDGWVRNRADGSVEALFHGADDQVEAMIRACHQGPPAARVDAVLIEPASAPDRAGFRQLPTV